MAISLAVLLIAMAPYVFPAPRDNSCVWPAKTINAEEKWLLPAPLENVGVCNLSENCNECIVVDEQLTFVGPENIIYSDLEPRPRAYRTWRCSFEACQRIIKIINNLCPNSLYTATNGRLISGCLAKVFKHDTRHKPVFVGRGQYLGKFDADISPQLTAGNVFDYVNLTDCIYERKKQKKSADPTKNGLPLVEHDGIFRSLRHAPLFTQISLMMTLGLIAFGVTPIGLILLLAPLNDEAPGRLWGGFLSGLGLASFGLISCFIFLG